MNQFAPPSISNSPSLDNAADTYHRHVKRIIIGPDTTIRLRTVIVSVSVKKKGEKKRKQNGRVTTYQEYINNNF